LLELPAPAADSLLDRWFAAQAELESWSADFTQTRTLKALKEPLKSDGRVWFRAPNRFRWELGDPAQTIAVREAATMVVLYPRLKRGERYPLGEGAAGQWRDALTLLETGFPRSREAMERRFKTVELIQREQDAELVLQPRSGRARKLIDEVRLVFGREDLAMRATELRFADGSTLRAATVPADFKVTEPLAGGGR
jgi:hypothetical protein